MIHVIATVETKPGKREALLAEFSKIVPLVHAEAGCIEYGAAVDLPSGIAVQAPVRDNVVVIVEKWQSLETLKAHLQAAHMVEYRTRIKDFVAGVQLQILQPATPT